MRVSIIFVITQLQLGSTLFDTMYHYHGNKNIRQLKLESKLKVEEKNHSQTKILTEV